MWALCKSQSVQQSGKEYNMINNKYKCSVQKLQNLSKQVTSVSEQVTAGANPGGKGQKWSFSPTSLFY